MVSKRLLAVSEKLPLGSKAKRHFVAGLAVLYCLLLFLALVYIKDKVTGVAADQHHYRYFAGSPQ